MPTASEFQCHVTAAKHVKSGASGFLEMEMLVLHVLSYR
jgi:hypothetical protein